MEDWRKFRPWIFAIEATLPLTDIPSHHEWEPILLKNDYVFTFQFSVNRYYVDVEREYLLDNFANINQFVEQNEIVKMQMTPLKFK